MSFTPPPSRLPHVGVSIFTTLSQWAAEYGAVNLGQGFPDFEPPAFLIQALSQAMHERHNQYAPAIGIAPLREQLALKLEAMHGAKIDPEHEITITSGATEALFCAIQAVAGPGDEVIVLDPCYDSYVPAIELAGARSVHVPLDPVSFRIDWQRLREAIGARTRLLIVNSPHNPSGTVFSAADLEMLAELLRAHRTLLLSDEVYEHIVFDGAEHQSVLRHPELAERAFMVSSFGKTYHCTGWKIGYCVAPRALSSEFRKIHQYLTFCSFNPAQWALAAMLREHPEHHLGLSDFYQQRRDHFRALLARTRLRPLPVAGGFFQLVDYSDIARSHDLEFCHWLVREQGVAAIPLSPFQAEPPQQQHLLRLCFAKSDATLQRAIERLQCL